MSDPEVRKFLTVSLAHLPDEVADRLLNNAFDVGSTVFAGFNGTVVYAPSIDSAETEAEYLEDLVERGFPESAARLLRYARETLDCSYVLFDSDGEALEGFETYEEDEEEVDIPEKGEEWFEKAKLVKPAAETSNRRFGEGARKERTFDDNPS